MAMGMNEEQNKFRKVVFREYEEDHMFRVLRAFPQIRLSVPLVRAHQSAFGRDWISTKNPNKPVYERERMFTSTHQLKQLISAPSPYAVASKAKPIPVATSSQKNDEMKEVRCVFYANRDYQYREEKKLQRQLEAEMGEMSRKYLAEYDELFYLRTTCGKNITLNAASKKIKTPLHEHQFDRSSNKVYNYSNAFSEALEQLTPFGLIERDQQLGLLNLTSLVRVLELNAEYYYSPEQLRESIYVTLGKKLTSLQAEALHHALYQT